MVLNGKKVRLLQLFFIWIPIFLGHPEYVPTGSHHLFFVTLPTDRKEKLLLAMMNNLRGKQVSANKLKNADKTKLETWK